MAKWCLSMWNREWVQKLVSVASNEDAQKVFDAIKDLEDEDLARLFLAFLGPLKETRGRLEYICLEGGDEFEQLRVLLGVVRLDSPPTSRLSETGMHLIKMLSTVFRTLPVWNRSSENV